MVENIQGMPGRSFKHALIILFQCLIIIEYVIIKKHQVLAKHVIMRTLQMYIFTTVTQKCKLHIFNYFIFSPVCDCKIEFILQFSCKNFKAGLETIMNILY